MSIHRTWTNIIGTKLRTLAVASFRCRLSSLGKGCFLKGIQGLVKNLGGIDLYLHTVDGSEIWLTS